MVSKLLLSLLVMGQKPFLETICRSLLDATGPSDGLLFCRTCQALQVGLCQVLECKEAGHNGGSWLVKKWPQTTTSKWCHNLKVFFWNCGQPKTPSWGRIFEARFLWGKEKVEFLFETSTFDQEKLPYCLIHRQSEWLNFNSPVPNHISWSDLQIFFPEILGAMALKIQFFSCWTCKKNGFLWFMSCIQIYSGHFGDCILELLVHFSTQFFRRS